MKSIVHCTTVILLVIGVVTLTGLVGCDSEPTPPTISVEVERVFPDLSFEEMTN